MSIAMMGMADFIDRFDDETLVVDVREPAEYVEGHVPGAICMPLAQVAIRRNELPTGRTVYVICASGNRSKVGAELLAAGGFDAVSVNGGTQAWRIMGRPVVEGREPR